MELRNGMFAVKLEELDRQYGRLQSRLEQCRSADHQRVREILRDVLDECRENDWLLRRSAEGCRSPAVAELAGVQRDYTRRTEEILREEMPRLMAGDDSPGEERAEAAALYAEYAMDFAAQSMREALAAALTALDLQMDWEEERKEESV